MKNAIVSVVGQDKVGIIAAVSALLARHQVNILDIRQTVMQDYFTMMMQVDLSAISCSLQDLKDVLSRLGGEMGLVIGVYDEGLFNAMHRI
ncbi:MAG: ACT domain-containing protein [Eubacteriales bacterium]|nr:ACT domain-containing protein [Eubacteriales bacterium]